MKTEEDEAFDDLAKRQGSWGGGFKAKQAMAADKLQEPVLDLDGHVVRDARKPKKAALAQPAQEPHEYDWSMLEAAKESLREHMARIKDLEAALKQALEALEHISKFGCNHVRGVCTCEYREAADAIKEALAQPPLPVQPQRPWVGLTDEEIAQGNKESWVTKQAWESAVWWAEAKLKEKNHG